MSVVAKLLAVLPSKLDSAIGGLKRAAIGFVAGFIVALFVLVFTGALLPYAHRDLSLTEIEQQAWSLWLAFYIACGAAVFAMIFGRVHLSRFWLWFVLAFGIICVIPFWPYKDGSLLPYGTPYVNFGFQTGDAIILAIHVSIALAVAAIFHWWLILRQRKKTR